jgi:hypothetical protein
MAGVLGDAKASCTPVKFQIIITINLTYLPNDMYMVRDYFSFQIMVGVP